MALNFLLLLAGLALLIKAADFLVIGAASLAKKWGVSGLVIGLTVISFGTSMPEVIVNVLASLKGSADIGMGNIVGSNISNTLLILGVTVVVAGSLRVDKSIINTQIPFSVLAALVLLVLASGSFLNGDGDNGLFRSSGIVLLCFFVVFMQLIFKEPQPEVEIEAEEIKEHSLKLSWLLVISGLAGLYVGAELAVSQAEIIARALGISEALIGITVLGVGTSLPELAACIAAALKKQSGMAIGNVIGSNIFNILWVLGVSSIISPLEYSSMLNVDIVLVIISSLILVPLILLGKKMMLTRNGGIILVIMYVAYIFFITIRG